MNRDAYTKINISEANCRAQDDGRAQNVFTFFVSDLNQLKNVMKAKAQMFGDVTLEQAMELGLFVCGSPATVLNSFKNHWNEMRFGNLLVLCQFATLPAVDLDNEPRFQAREVSEIWANWYLSPESVATNLLAPQARPQPRFRLRGIAAQLGWAGRSGSGGDRR